MLRHYMRLNMTSKITVVVDLDDTEMLEERGSLKRGVYGVDRDGVYHMYYSSKTYLVSFSPHTCREDEEQQEKEYYYSGQPQEKRCEYCSEFTCNCEQIIDKNIQAQERTGQQ